MTRGVLSRLSIVLATAGAVGAACGQGAAGAGPPPGPPGITGTLTSVTPFVPRTEDCVQPGDRPADAPVSSDDQLSCTDPGTELVGSVLVEEHPDRRLDGAGLPPGDKAVVSIEGGSQVIRADGEGYAEATFGDLRVGQVVEVWFTGPVAESYPVQAGTKAVVIRQPAEE
jgi:hypothetical protein